MDSAYALNDEKELLRAKVVGMANLSTIPVTLKNVLEVVENDNSSTSDLVKVVEQDQSLAAKVLAVANSAFYGYGGRVKSISQAAVILGFNMVRNLAISVSLFDTTDKLAAKFLSGLWRHSFEVASVSALLADRTGLARKDNAFLAGLISDIGRVILYQIFESKYLDVYSDGGEGVLERETAAFGATHPEVGAWFAEGYRFQKECVLTIEEHHCPEKLLSSIRSGSHPLVALVYLADVIVSEHKNDSAVDIIISPEHDAIMEAVYLDPESMAEVRAEYLEMAQSINSIF